MGFYPSDKFTLEIPIIIEPSPRWIRTKFGWNYIADSKKALLHIDYGPRELPNYYFPKEDVNFDYFIPNNDSNNVLVQWDIKSSPYKGKAQYRSFKSGDIAVNDITWSYPDPIPKNPKIKDFMCFFNESVDITIDGETVDRPITPWSRN